MLGCRLAFPSLVPNMKILAESKELLLDSSIYQQLVCRLIYLTIKRSNLTFVVSVVSQLMHSSRISHLEAVHHILRYFKMCISLGLFYKSGTQSGLSIYIDVDYT